MTKHKIRNNNIGKARIGKQWLAIWMILVLLVQTMTGAVYGAPSSDTDICTHHEVHTAECGYQEAGTCSHIHGEACYEGLDLTATPSDATPSEATPSETLEYCTHIHDDNCGYAVANPCGYRCKICAGEELSLEEQARRMEAQNQRQDYYRSRTAPASRYPFVIGSEAVLRELADKVNGGDTWADGKITYGECTYVLTADISLSLDWIPVGTEEHPFTGTFDGDGYVVNDMVISDTSLKYSGLFGYVKGGTVENLGVKDADIRAGSAPITVDTWDFNHAGAVAGALDGGTVRRCYSTGNVNAATGTEYLKAGGIVGLAGNGSSVESCYSTGNVLANIAGGIVGGLENSNLENCYSTGKIAIYDAGVNRAVGGGLTGTSKSGDGGEVQVTGSIAFNPSIDGGDAMNTSRCFGFAIVWGEGSSYTFQDLYAFSGMKVNGSTVTNWNQANQNNGADLNYDATTGTFSTSWKDIFSDISAWDTEPGRLPVLKGIGGQDGEIPEWIADAQGADLYISSEAELKAFRERVNGVDGTPDDFAGKTVRLTADIQLTEEWVPIGDDRTYGFKGTFDGGGHVIRGLTVRTSGRYAGLFGTVNGTIQNLGVKDVDIKGRAYGGAIAGSLSGTIQNCYSTGYVEATHYAGGIVGSNRGEITNCYSTAGVKASVAGGIIGENVHKIKNCYSTGTVSASSGGLAGGMVGAVERHGGMLPFITNLAALNQSVAGGQDQTHRMIGEIGGFSKYDKNYAFSGMKVNGSPVTGGSDRNADGADLSYDPVTKAFSADWGTIFDDVSAWDIVPGKLPTLKGIGGQDGEIPPWIVDAQEADLYIGSEAELIAFRDRVNGTDGLEANTFSGKTVRLTADITLSSGSDWVPIGYESTNGTSHYFHGTFDGDGHVIRNVRITDENQDVLGLFGWITEGTIQNLGVENVQVRGRDGVGGIVGMAAGGSSILNCYSTGSVTGRYDIGGLVGMTYGEDLEISSSDKVIIKNCWHAGTVEAKGNQSSQGEEGYAGGIAGRIIAGTGLEHCYSAENTVAGFAAGGLVGCNALGGLAGGMRYNAALSMAVDGESDAGRIFGTLRNPSGESFCQDNYAYSGMSVNKKTIEGDDGTGRNGRDATARNIVMNETLFPDSDWIREEGYYPRLRVFDGKDKRPLDTWLQDQPEGGFGIELEAPASYRFPSVREGYRIPAGKTVTVKNTGKGATGELAVTLVEQKLDGVPKPADASDYFTISKTVVDSIAVGEAGALMVTPVAGLKVGTYTAQVRIAGRYNLSGTYTVEFTVQEAGRSGGSSVTTLPPSHTILTGNVPSSVATGIWERQPGGAWKFYKDAGTDAGGSAQTDTTTMSGGPGVGGSSAGLRAIKEWLLIDGFWYLFDEKGNMAAGWACVNGTWYYLSTAAYAAANPPYKEGAMVTGWLYDPVSQRWFWLDASGAMATGWREIDGVWYYFNPEADGTMGALVEGAVH